MRVRPTRSLGAARRRLGAIAAALLPAALGPAPAPAAAQRTGDRPTLVFTIAPGYSFGEDLWRVERQAFITPAAIADTFALGRTIRESFNLYIGGSYFPGPMLGVAAEIGLVGLGYSTQCQHLFASGNARAPAVCTNLGREEKSASAILISAGPILRLASRSIVSPYIRAQVGALLVSQSAVETSTFIANQNPGVPGATQFIRVYDDDGGRDIRFGFSLGIGAVAAVAPGYQFRVEVRDNILGVQRVTGAAERDGLVPPTETVYRHVPVLTVGFDVVLERRRGRRY